MFFFRLRRTSIYQVAEVQQTIRLLFGEVFSGRAILDSIKDYLLLLRRVDLVHVPKEQLSRLSLSD